MTTRRRTIGRTLPAAINITDEPGQVSEKRHFTLLSGRNISFTREVIPYEELECKTFVNQQVNGREQSALTAESLRDITSTLHLQQFFPAIGIRHTNGKIELLDGSRRRASALIVHCPLETLITDEPLTIEEASELARAIQTAKEHSLREVGLRLMTLKNSGLSQKEIAMRENLSQAKVTRALQAAAVSGELLSAFPVQSELTYPDYKALLDIEEMLKAEGYQLAHFIRDNSEEINAVEQKLNSAEEIKNSILTILRRQAAVLTEKTYKEEKPVLTPLWYFTDKNRYARKKMQGRAFSYEFNRLPVELQKALDTAIKNVLENHFEE